MSGRAWQDTVGKFRPLTDQSDLASAAIRRYGFRMADHIYKRIEIIGSSEKSIEDAIRNAIAKAHESLRNLRWFEVVETRGNISDGVVAHWQVTLKIGFTLD